MNRLFALLSFLAILILYPYSKEVTKFRSEDNLWQTLSSGRKIKNFDPQEFRFSEEYTMSKKTHSLSGKEIRIKGFLNRHTHGGAQAELFLTETVSHVCFMCTHDASHISLLLHPRPGEDTLYAIPPDTYVQIQGTFTLSNSADTPQMPLFQLKNAHLEQVILYN